MPTPDTADHEYRKPLDTTRAVLDDLSSLWDALSHTAQGDLARILASFRARLYRAEGDAARGLAPRQPCLPAQPRCCKQPINPVAAPFLPSTVIKGARSSR